MLLSTYTRMSGIERQADLGYEAIDIDFCGVIYEGNRHDSILDGEDWKSNLDPYIEMLAQRKLVINSVHLPYTFDYTDTESAEYQRCYAMTCRALQAADYIGAKWAVLHIKTVDASTPHKSVEYTTDYVRRLFADTKVQNVGIAVENGFKMPIEGVMEVHDILKAEGYHVGLCLDFGHAHITGWQDYDVVDITRRLGARLKVLHVNDNCRNGDHHREPFAGTIPWISVMQTLKEISFQGEFTYELNRGRIPVELCGAYEKYCVEVGRYLISVYENYEVKHQEEESK